jgi:two-component system cell cycle sensor histidine kinase/response regulator CckA
MLEQDGSGGLGITGLTDNPSTDYRFTTMEVTPQRKSEAALQSGNLPSAFGLCDAETSGSSEQSAIPTLIRILIVEDNDHDAQLVIEELKRVGVNYESHLVKTESEYLAQLDTGFDLILSDYSMPGFGAPRALELLKTRTDLDIPFIVISGTIGEETAVAIIKDGAADYLMKDRIGRLGPAVNRALREVQERREKKRLQQQFLEAQKMEVIGQLSAGVAHDFNNVLAVIMGYSDLLEEDLGPDHPLQRYTEEIRQAARRATGLTRQLLIFSRKETVQPEMLDLNDVVVNMDKLLRRLVEENIELRIECRRGLGRIKADSGHIWQVLMNLVVNARDAMIDGGRLVIQTGAQTVTDASPQARVGVTLGDYVVLSVSDTGMGMSAEVKARLFEPFFTTKPVGKGTGLGLVTCQTIVRQSGGHIEVDSELARGTTFRIYFPVAGLPGEALPEAAPQANHAPRGTETLLIVEDEPAVRLLAQSVLKALGYDVLIALNGHDALRVTREHQGPRIALVIADVVMPRMGGADLAEWLRSLDPHLKILFTSGYTHEPLTFLGDASNGINFLPKPYAPVALARKVREMLDTQT